MEIDIPQNFFFFLIFWLFYNTDLIEKYTDSNRRIFIYRWINDIVILIMEDNIDINNRILEFIYKTETENWYNRYGIIFIKNKYILIYFRKFHY